jgi:hypothetical protein
MPRQRPVIDAHEPGDHVGGHGGEVEADLQVGASVSGEGTREVGDTTKRGQRDCEVGWLRFCDITRLRGIEQRRFGF